VLFWIGFVIVVAWLFIANQDRIRQTLENTQVVNRLLGRDISDHAADAGLAPQTIPAITEQGRNSETAPQDTAQPVQPQTAAASGQSAVKPEPVQPAQQNPAAQQAAQQAQSVQAQQMGADGTVIERSIYFVEVDKDGTIMRNRVSRELPVSDSPMTDALKVLLQGPSPAEQRSGLISLIPKDVKLLSATVLGDTAHISFSEEFQYNQYGIEGYAGQLKQIIWTVTEFSNVENVQFLIEGRKVSYLGESIQIANPLNRDSLE
jgi:spore germination protein GerM